MVKAAAIVVSNVGAPPSVGRATEEQSLARRHHAASCVGGPGVIVAQQLAGAGGQSRGRSGRVSGVGKSQHFGACVCRRRSAASASRSTSVPACVGAVGGVGKSQHFGACVCRRHDSAARDTVVARVPTSDAHMRSVV